MVRSMIILATVLNVVMSSALANAADAPKVLLILREGMPTYLDTELTKEVGVMKSMLEDAGFKVMVASPDGLPIKGSSLTFTPNLKLSDVKVDDYIGVIFACFGGGGAFQLSVSPIAVSIAKRAVTQGKPVAASHSSVIILAEAGVLVGKHYTFNVDGQLRDSRFTGAIYGGTGMVQDGNIITCGVCPGLSQHAGFPDCTVELTQAFITALTAKK